MAGPFSKEVPELLQSHLDHLLGSAISIAVIQERGYLTAMGKTPLKEAGFSQSQQRAPGILIPLYSPDGSKAGFQYRPDNPRIDGRGKPIKYETPRGSQIRIDTHPRCIPQLKDPSIHLWITEGTKKVDALVSQGSCAIGLNGVWGFKGKNQRGGITFQADFDYIALNGRLVYSAYDSDIVTKPQVRKAMERLAEHLKRKGAQVKTVQLPQGEDGKTGVDDYLATGHTLDDLYALAADEPVETDDPPVAVHSPIYVIHEGQHCVIKNVKDIGKVYSPLCNFTAQIKEEVILDDGIDEARSFSVEGKLKGGGPLPRVEVPSTQFAGMGWVPEKWGAKAVVYAGSTVKDHLRCFLQLSMNGSEPRRVFTHTGWREVDGERVFLTASGAIGKPGIDVHLIPPQDRYRLPLDPAEVAPQKAMAASLRSMDFGKPEVQYALWAQMYLAPLSEILNPAFMLWVVGRSGALKSGVTALALQHFGEFDYRSFPATWEDTAGDIERALFIMKDVPLAIDDWFPGASHQEQQEQNKKARMVIRAQGNRAGKGRLKPDISARKRFIPRGLVLSSAEQLPRGQSNNSRIFVVEVGKGEVNLPDLIGATRESHLYGYAMAHYILWLRDNWDFLKYYLPQKCEEWRDEAISSRVHMRFPTSLSWLYAGLDLGMSFALEAGAICGEEAAERRERGWELLLQAARRQAARTEEEGPTSRFLNALATLLTQQRILILPKSQQTLTGANPNQPLCGWEDQHYYYLLGDAVYAEVCRFYSHGLGHFAFDERAVWKDLVDCGLVVPTKGEGYKYKVTIGEWGDHKTERVIRLKKTAIDDIQVGDEFSEEESQ